MKQKLLAVFLSLTLLLSSFAVGGLATPVEAMEGSVAVQLTVNYGGPHSEPVTISQPGVYTFKLDGLQIAKGDLSLIKLEESSPSANGAPQLNGALTTTKSVKINGEVCETISKTAWDGSPSKDSVSAPQLYNDSRAFDITYFNVYYNPGDLIKIPEVETITSVEVEIEITDPAPEVKIPETPENSIYSYGFIADGGYNTLSKGAHSKAFDQFINALQIEGAKVVVSASSRIDWHNFQFNGVDMNGIVTDSEDRLSFTADAASVYAIVSENYKSNDENSNNFLIQISQGSYVGIRLSVVAYPDAFVPFDMGLYVGGNDPDKTVKIQDYGTYTIRTDTLKNDYGWIMVKGTNNNLTTLKERTQIKFTSLKINDTEMTFTNGTYTYSVGANGTVEAMLMTPWGTREFIEEPIKPANSVEVTFEIIDPDAEVKPDPDPEVVHPEGEEVVDISNAGFPFNDGEAHTFALTRSVNLNETVTVHIMGCSDSDFRMWLANGQTTMCADPQWTAGHTSGNFDFTITLTCAPQNDGTEVTFANNLLFKSAYGSTLNNFTLTHVAIVYPEHVHQYDGYGYDLNNHWQVCTVCGEKSESSPHVGTPCEVCGGVKHIDGETDIALSSASTNENVVYDDDSNTLTVQDNTVELLTFPLGQKVKAGEKVSVHIIGEITTNLTDNTSAGENAARVWIGGNSDFSETEYVSGTGTFEINKEFTVKSNGDNSSTDTLAIKGAAYGKKLPSLKIYHVAVKLPEKEPVECLPDEIVLDINEDPEIIGGAYEIVNGELAVSNVEQIAVRLPKNVPQGAEIKVHVRGTVTGGLRIRLNENTDLYNGKASAWNTDYSSYTGEFDDIITLNGVDAALRYLHFKGPQGVNITDLTITHIGIVYPEHEHTYADSEYKSDETGHWQVCTKCEEESEHTPHTEKVVSDEATGHHSVCETCGYKMSDTVEHSFGSWSKLDETHHTRSCEKCDYFETDEHKMGNWTKLNDTQHTRTCSDCEHSEAAEHKFGAWTKLDDEQHTHVCEDCEFSQNENHNWDDGVVTKAPSEEEEGIKTYTCNDCKATKEETIPKADHKHSYGDDWKSDETGHWHECTAGDGDSSDFAEHTYKDGVCSVCGYVHTAHTRGNNPVYTPAENGHTFKCDICGVDVHEGHTEEKIPAVDPTCTTSGSKAGKKCSLCNEVIVEPEEIPALGHSWGAWTDSKDGTHHERSCTRCDHKETEDHKWDAGKVTKPATHTENGEKTFACTVCGATKTEVVEKESGHTFGDWTVTKAPTETETGTAERKCTVNDGGIETIELPVLTDTEFWTKEETKAPTCEADGTTTYTAKKYDGIKVEVTVKALGHKYSEPAWNWAADHSTATATFTCENDSTHAQVVNATITYNVVYSTASSEGSTTFTAAAIFDGKTYTDVQIVVLPRTDPNVFQHTHTWSWRFDATSHSEVCSGCGQYTNYARHTFVNGVCIDCGYVADVIDVNTPIEDTDQNSEEETSGDDLTVDDTQTPVESNPETGLAVSALTLALAAVATVFSKRR